MRVEIEVELPDAPGELSRVLEIVASHGGNVQSVLHEHERAANGRVPVVITVEVDEGKALRLTDALARTHRLLRIGTEGGPSRSALMLVGHVFEADLRSLLDEVFVHGGELGTIDARVEGRTNPSAVLVTVSAPDDATLDQAVGALRRRADEADLMVIEQARGEHDE